MSFSGEIRTELADVMSGARHCRIAELSAMLTYSGCLAEEQEGALAFSSDKACTAEKCSLLLQKLFPVRPELLEEKGRRGQSLYIISVREEEAARVRAACGFTSTMVNKECCRRAYLRGAFLVCGSVSDPNTSYHLEFVCRQKEQAERLRKILMLLGPSGKITERKGRFVLYIKEGNEVSDVLGFLGARVGLMELENARILREMRGSINRRVNCETANIEKTVSAAVRQIEDIRLIEEKMGLDTLPNGLDEMARVRLQYREATLQELGALLDPPVGKSGVNHRLRKISAIAKRLRGE